MKNRGIWVVVSVLLVLGLLLGGFGCKAPAGKPGGEMPRDLVTLPVQGKGTIYDVAMGFSKANPFTLYFAANSTIGRRRFGRVAKQKTSGLVSANIFSASAYRMSDARPFVSAYAFSFS